MAVTDTVSRVAWSFRVAHDGGLIHGEPFYRVEIPEEVSQGPLRSRADRLTFDDQGFANITTKLAI